MTRKRKRKRPGTRTRPTRKAKRRSRLLFVVFMPELPIAAIERLMRKAGAERVSPQAAAALRRVLEDSAAKLSSKAAKLARHAGRKTVTEEDIRLAD
mgnify:CR=1 FL=1